MTCNFRTIIADTAPELLGTASMFNCLFGLLRLYHIRVPDQHQDVRQNLSDLYLVRH